MTVFKKFERRRQSVRSELQDSTEKTTNKLVAGYWRLRNEGFSHEDAIAGMKQISHVG